MHVCNKVMKKETITSVQKSNNVKEKKVFLMVMRNLWADFIVLLPISYLHIKPISEPILNENEYVNVLICENFRCKIKQLFNY